MSFRSTPALVEVAGLLRGGCQNVVCLTGAGISCGAGIPDFRSKGGMYETLRPDLLTATPTQRYSMSVDPTQGTAACLFFAFPPTHH
jgi:NAD-dependent SIR2 family protein deacetylase